MKIPTAKKLPSGSWFVRIRVNGEDIGITRPTEKEALAEAMAIKAGVKAAEKTAEKNLTVGDCVDRYIDARTATASPSTIRGYKSDRKNRFQALMGCHVAGLKDIDYQRAIDRESRNVSAKTIRNAWGTIAAAVEAETGQRPRVNLPAAVRQEHPFLQPEQIPVFVEAVRGRSTEAAILLGLHSMRRSEIFGAKWSSIDVKAKVIHVRGSAVLDESGHLTQKPTNKTRASRRDIPIIIPRLQELAEDATDKDAYIYTFSPTFLYEDVNRVCRRCGFPEIGVHGLRHSFASLAYHVGVPEKIAATIGGWDDYATMHNIYTHLAQSDLAKSASAMRDFFAPKNSGKNSKMAMKMAMNKKSRLF